MIPPTESRVLPVVITVRPGINDLILPPPGQTASYRYRMGFLVENQLVKVAQPAGTGHTMRMVTSNEFSLGPLSNPD